MDAVPSPAKPDRGPLLLVFVHGNNGTPEDWDPLMETIRHNPVLGGALTMRFSSHPGRRTLVGVQRLAGALVDEIEGRTHEADLLAAPRIRIYLFGHSLGGLVIRCALPALFEREPRVVPVGFCTLASPHVGCARPGGGIFKSLWKWSIEQSCKTFYAQTGSDLIYYSLETQEHSLEETLLYQLSDAFYLNALSRFQHRTLVASPFFDMLVPYSSAACNLVHPYDEDELQRRDDDHPCCVWGYSRFAPDCEALIGKYARAGAAGRPESAAKDAAEQFTEDDAGWQTDRHGFVRFPRQVMSNMASLSFRRLDVQLECVSRWMVHDAFLKKRVKGLLPDAGESAEHFLRLLADIVAVDVSCGE